MADFHVAIYNGVFVDGDAISGSVRRKLDLIQRLRARGAPVRCTVFTGRTDHVGEEVEVVGSVHDLWKSRAFNAASLHLFEFGIYYGLFDARLILQRNKVKAAVYHSVTPPSLAETSEQAAILKRSLDQLVHFDSFDAVLADSEYNQTELIVAGVRPQRITVVHLPPDIPELPRIAKSDPTLRVLFVGRFVRSKGIADLITAFRHATELAPTMDLTLAGHPQFSSSTTLTEISALAEDRRPHAPVHLVLAPSSEHLARLYSEADVLVMPSYHEGLCLPVLEALSAGCQVIAYDAGNLPNVVDGVGDLVTLGDVTALSAKLVSLARAKRIPVERREVPMIATTNGNMPLDVWHAEVRRHLAGYSVSRFDAGVVKLLRFAAERVGHRSAVAAFERVSQELSA